MYNTTNLDASNNIFDIVVALNDLSGGLLSVFILASVFIICVVVFKRTDDDTKKVILVSSTITMITGLILWALELIGLNITIFPIILFIGSLIAYKMG